MLEIVLKTPTPWSSPRNRSLPAFSYSVLLLSKWLQPRSHQSYLFIISRTFPLEIYTTPGTRTTPVMCMSLMRVRKQLYVVFVLADGGRDLESFVLVNFNEARSLLLQVTLIS